MAEFLSPVLRHLRGAEVPWPPAMVPAPAPAPAPPPSDQPDIVDTSSFNTGLMVFLLVVWASVGHKVASQSRYLGEGSVACGMGLAAGTILLIFQHFTALDKEALRQLLTFNPADFFTYFLPPIIFYAGLSVEKKKFFDNFGSIATLGILGTYILFAIIAFCLFAISMLPNLLTFTDCLALGAIFAATDTVAVLQVIRPEEKGVLYSLVFGEGVMNDATSVAILRAVQSYSEAKVSMAAGSTMLGVLRDFLYLFVASLILGMVFGLGIAFLLKFLRSDSSPQEVALIGMLAYLSYLCGELLGISGIVSLFCCGVVVSHYALHNVTSMTRVTTVSAFHTLSYIAEGCIFIYVGLDTLDPLKWTNTYFSELIWLFVVLLLLLLVGRALYVVPACWLHNLWSAEKVSVRDVVIIWWGGLMRGAVSVALIYRYFDPHGQAQLDAHRSTLITTTLLLVLFSTMVLGALTKPLFDLVQGHEGEELSSMMELMPHRRRRNRAAGLGTLSPSSRARAGGFGGVTLYAAVDMSPIAEAEAGVIDGGMRSRHLDGTPLVHNASELSLESGSSGSPHGVPPELNGLDDPDRWWRKTQQQRLGMPTGASPKRSPGASIDERQRGLGLSPRPPEPRAAAGYSAPSPVLGPPATALRPGARQQARPLQLQRPGASPAAAAAATVGPTGSGHQRQPSDGSIVFNELDVEGAAGGWPPAALPVEAALPPEPEPLISPAETPGSIATLWRSFDAEYMQPIFGGPGSHHRAASRSTDALAELQEVDTRRGI